MKTKNKIILAYILLVASTQSNLCFAQFNNGYGSLGSTNGASFKKLANNLCLDADNNYGQTSENGYTGIIFGGPNGNTASNMLGYIYTNDIKTGSDKKDFKFMRFGYATSNGSNGHWYDFFVYDRDKAATVLGQLGNIGIGITNPQHKLSVAGNIAVDNGISMVAKNSAGDYEIFMHPRWSDNKMYINYGAEGFNIRNNSIVSTMYMTKDNKVGIGTTSPSARLEVNNGSTNGAIKIVDGTQGAGKVLTSDANGLATWAVPTSSSQINMDNSYIGIDAQNNPRLALIKKSGFNPAIATDNTNDIIFSKLNTTITSDIIGMATLTELMRITNSGNVGIGNSLPYSKLDVNGNIYTALHASTDQHDPSERGTFYIGSKSGTSTDGFTGMKTTIAAIGSGNGGSIAFQTWGYNIARSRDVMVIDPQGDVGIGITNPQEKLSVAGNIAMDNRNAFKAKNSEGTYEIFMQPRWSDNKMYINYGSAGFNIRNNSNVSTMYMTDDNKVGIGTTSPTVNLEINGSTNPTSLKLVSGSDHLQFNQTNNNTGSQIEWGDDATDKLYLTHHNNTGNVMTNVMTLTKDNVGIGTTTPSAKLEINNGTTSGAIKIVDGTQGAGKVLTSDANGLATWAAPTSSSVQINQEDTYIGIDAQANPRLALIKKVGANPAIATDNTNDIIFSKLSTTITSGNIGTATLTELMRITNNGNVGIGNNSPYTKLDVTGNIYTALHGSNNLHDASERGTYYIGSKSGNTTDGFAGMKTTVAAIGSGNGGSIAFQTWGNGISTSRDVMVIDPNGNVGIGITNPQYKLSVSGDIGVDNAITLKVKNSAGTYETFMHPRWSDNKMYINYGSAGFNIRNNSSVSTMYMTNDNKVGIGNTSPANMLDVGTDNAARTQNLLHVHGGAHFNNDLGVTDATMAHVTINTDTIVKGCALTVAGPTYIGDWHNIESNEIKSSNMGTYYLWVQGGVVSEDFVVAPQADWRDYVFAPEYKLPALSEVESFIKTNRHLEGVPSESDVKRSGYNVSSLSKVFLEKIEHLYLYSIAQEKKVNSLQEINTNLKKENERQQQLLSGLEQRIAALEKNQGK